MCKVRKKIKFSQYKTVCFHSDRKCYINRRSTQQILDYISIIKSNEISLYIFQINKRRKFFTKIHSITQRCSVFIGKGEKK